MNKHKVLPIVTCAYLLMAFCLPACSGGKKDNVVVIEKTRTYHREACPPVHMAKTQEMTLNQAKGQNLRPCTVCKPDAQ